MNRSKWLILVGALALLVLSPALAAPQHSYYQDPAGGWTRNVPAGSVNDPGSHLTYILDTGVNARELLGDVSLKTATATPLVDLAAWLDQNGDGLLDETAIIQNFVGITNTSPTMAVTVHFRYFNDNCDDVLDFLVVLTCNDTLLFDPFNYQIPGTGGENTRDRIFGPARAGKVLTPIPTSIYGSGRFILTAAASGATTDADADPEILFPFELANGQGKLDNGQITTGECNIAGVGTLPPVASLEATLAGSVRNVGEHAGLVADNLHVYNAAQISFNFLIGYQTYAVPWGNVFQSGGTNAWARPAVYVSDTGAMDGPHADVGLIVTGGETLKVWTLAGTGADVSVNGLYLRSEVQGGVHSPKTVTPKDGDPVVGGYATYGALGTPPLLGLAPEDVIQHFFSVVDDYNGSNNAGIGTLKDLSANISPAATTWVLQIYDNNEQIFDWEAQAPPINVSPPAPPGTTADLKMVCICLRTFLTTTIAAGTNVDDLTVQDLADVFGDEILNGGGATGFAGLLKQTPPDDYSGGWIRFVRDNTNVVSLAGGDAGNATLTGITLTGSAHGAGTSTFAVPKFSDAAHPTFLTGANIFLKQFGFGALSWDYTVASDPAVSDSGDPTP